jgi:hypothetical protein
MTTTVALSPLGRLQFSNNGVPLSGGLLFTYANLTQNKQTTYQDGQAATPNVNPIVLDSNGSCSCWLDISKIYTMVLSPSTDTDPPTNPFWTQNYVQSVAGGVPLLVGLGGTGRTDGVGLILECGQLSNIGNVFTGTSNPVPAALSFAQMYLVSVGVTNTGAAQFNVNGFGAAPVLINGQAMTGGELQPNTPYFFAWDGVEFNAMPIGVGIAGQYVGLTLYAGTVGGSANALTLTITGAPFTKYVKGQRIIFQATQQNTGATTINVNGVGNVTCQYGGFACTGGEIGYNSTLMYGQWIEAFYDGTYFQLNKAFAANNGVGSALSGLYVNGWSNFGGSDQVGMYFKDAMGFVHLTGVITGGSVPSNICTLPSGKGLWPNALIGFSCLANNAPGGFTVSAAGVIAATSGSGTGFGLDGATWYGNPSS